MNPVSMSLVLMSILPKPQIPPMADEPPGEASALLDMIGRLRVPAGTPLDSGMAAFLAGPKMLTGSLPQSVARQRGLCKTLFKEVEADGGSER
jgi:hypothetical protein